MSEFIVITSDTNGLEDNSATEFSCNPVIGYKIFQSDWKCHGYQYQMHKVNTYEGPIVMTQSGFHFCPRALDCLHYYAPDSRNKYAKVKGSGRLITEDDKCVTDHLEILEEISHKDFMKLCNGQLSSYYQRNENGIRVPKAQITYRNGIKFGPSIEWSANGKLKNKCYYVKGKLHGSIEKYNGQGIITHCELHIKGKLIHKWPVIGGWVQVGYYNPGLLSVEGFNKYINANYDLKYTEDD